VPYRIPEQGEGTVAEIGPSSGPKWSLAAAKRALGLK
jgi:hypothetical protein